jgi:hypothetical protein
VSATTACLNAIAASLDVDNSVGREEVAEPTRSVLHGGQFISMYTSVLLIMIEKDFSLDGLSTVDVIRYAVLLSSDQTRVSGREDSVASARDQ